MAKTEVAWEDQQRINTFGKLNNHLIELKLMIKAKQKLLEHLDDAGNELMLSDDEVVRYAMGECFMHIDKDAAEEKIQSATEEANKELEADIAKAEEITEQMSDLKQLLYAKFGNTINLEDPDQP